MVYTAEEKSRMDYLLTIFGDYIRSNKEFDIVYSEKLGYLSLVINTKTGIIEDVSPLKDFDALLKEMFFQISNDVLALKMVGYHDDIELFPEEIVEVHRRVEPILNTMTQDREYCLAKLDYYLEHVND
jgi:hypothetical protein